MVLLRAVVTVQGVRKDSIRLNGMLMTLTTPWTDRQTDRPSPNLFQIYRGANCLGGLIEISDEGFGCLIYKFCLSIA